MLDMVIRERGHGIVAVVVVGLVAHVDALHTGLFGGLLKVFGQQLALLVEIVAGTLVVLIFWYSLNRFYSWAMLHIPHR